MHIGKQVAEKYVIESVLGGGGMGLVFRARDLVLERPVAIKLIHPNLVDCSGAQQRFRDEARAAARVRHPNVIPVIEYGPSELGHFLGMTFVDGQTLGRRLTLRGPMTFARARGFVDQLLLALIATHAAGVFHSNVKTDNLLVDKDSDHLTLIDFGLARVADRFTTPSKPQISGTPEYLAPERIRGADPDVSSDLYAVGVVLYELLAGVAPFSGETQAEVFASHCESAYPLLETHTGVGAVPRGVDDLLCRALDKNPRVRIGSALEFREAIAMIGTDDGSGRTTTTAACERQQARVTAAIQVGQPDEIIESCVELAQLLTTHHDLQAAAVALERALAVIERMRPPALQIWRLSATLAGVYGSLGQLEVAEHHARTAVDRAAASRSYAGHVRSRALLDLLRSRRSSAQSPDVTLTMGCCPQPTRPLRADRSRASDETDARRPLGAR